MRLLEFNTPAADSEELAALSQFLLARSDDTGAQKKISVAAFLKLANDMGVSLSKDQLVAQVGQEPLSNFIDNIQGDEIIFKGNDTDVDATMSVDQARATVDQMSKRALGKRD